MTDHVDPNGTAPDAAPARRLTHEHSLYAQMFNITSCEYDPEKWNRDWEKALRTLSFADVYAQMGERMSNRSLSATDMTPRLHQLLKECLLHQQSRLSKLWDDHLVEQFESISIAWLFLDEKERNRHLLKGLEEATKVSPFGQDSRALCPEITVSAMSKQKGRPFIDLLNTYQAKLKEVTMGDPYLVANERWDTAPLETPPSLSETFPPSAFEILTLVRNYFILSVSHQLLP
jgi:hypothetical protein